ncbi:MAG: polyphosphate:AMP phosphotransferase [Verrucomicrobia bacterium]|jgi:polyphosphate:AMP phosphotransferase|nr:polyphosphate:AMP phosphotransferase [Verrucomicrobiota bacterium]
MFDSAELGQTLSAQRYDAELPELRSKLLQAHFDLRAQKFPVILLVSGADGAGKGELVHRLNEWLDPRGVETHAFWAQSDEERERPPFWRYWRSLPGRGRIGIIFGTWYSQPIVSRVFGRLKRGEFDAALDRIARFEQMLADDGALIVKLWLHLPKKAQKKRLKKLEEEGRLAPDEWKHFKLFDRFTKVSGRALRRTDTGAAPWHVIESTDRRYREITAGNLLLQALRTRIDAAAGAAPRANGTPADAPPEVRESILDHVDLSCRLTEAEYERQLEKLQAALGKLTWAAWEKKRSMVLVFEGWDAAGKGSSIRRVTQAIDPRLYRVVGIAAPTDEERAHHYLWRFWRQLPRAGYTTIFDRSWYGRVLVERVEGFARYEEWSRAYHELNDFEEQLVEHGIVVNKFWLHVSPQEQLRRFRERQKVVHKRYKITEEDWRNREKWKAYQTAIDEMVARCSTEYAPWTIVSANDKRHARIQILKTIVGRLRAAL